MSRVSRRTRGRRVRLFSLLAMAAAAVLSCSAPAAHAFQPRVEDEFFGINAPELLPMSWTDPGALGRHLAGIEAAGIDWVRSSVAWSSAEPLPPVAGVHAYAWTFLDPYIAQLARHGLTMVPIPDAAPPWARSTSAISAGCGSRSPPDVSRAPDYGAFVRAVVARYGRNGAFWSQNPQLPYRPVHRVELFNEPNWAGAWCPGPDPETYARHAVAGADGAHAADPAVDVAIGGLVTVREDVFRNGRVYGMAADRFLRRAVSAQPGLSGKVETVAIHLYDPDTDVNISLLGWLRARLAEAGLDSAELLVSEFGWHTRGSSDAVTESERVANYHAVVGQLARTDCRIEGIAAHNWVSREADAGDPEDWFGLARAATSQLYPAGQAYADEIALYTGRGPAPAPRETIPLCGGPPPDHDGDAVPDAADDYPLDPTRSTGSGESPPPDPDQPPAPNMPPRLPSSFFGVSVREMPWEADLRRLYYDSMQEARFGSVRDSILWRHAEPKPRGDPEYRLMWSESDPRVLGLAKRGIRVEPIFTQAPGWLPSSEDPASSSFATFIADYARRYGRGGSFWQENRHLDADLAVRDYEVWSEVNVRSSGWDGQATAAKYAQTYARARAAIRSVDAMGRAIVPLNEYGSAGEADAFLRGMVAARPDLAGAIDAVYVQSLQPRDSAQVEAMTARVRRALDETGNGAAAIKVGFGWYTSGSGAVSESQRAGLYSATTGRLARSDCGVENVYADAWTMPENDATNPWHWIGIAGKTDGALKPSGAAYADALEPYLGFGATAAPRQVVHSCGKPDPDRDADGTPDPVDDHPLDPERFDASPPQLSLVGPSGGKRAGTRARFQLSASDPSGTGGFECRLDGGAFVPCAPTHVTRRLRAGPHTLRVRVSDAAGNEAVGAKTWRTRR